MSTCGLWAASNGVTFSVVTLADSLTSHTITRIATGVRTVCSYVTREAFCTKYIRIYTIWCNHISTSAQILVNLFIEFYICYMWQLTIYSISVLELFQISEKRKSPIIIKTQNKKIFSHQYEWEITVNQRHLWKFLDKVLMLFILYQVKIITCHLWILLNKSGLKGTLFCIKRVF